MDAANGGKDPSFKFSQSFEMGGLGARVVEELNGYWQAKKVGLDLDADRKEEKNQARIEFWSFTGAKMGDISVKESGLINPGPLKAKLKQMRAKNAELCGAEIKRINEAQKAREKAEKAVAEKAAAK